ncbi:MAG: transporter [Janthinobacterium lividum]
MTGVQPGLPRVATVLPKAGAEIGSFIWSAAAALILGIGTSCPASASDAAGASENTALTVDAPSAGISVDAAEGPPATHDAESVKLAKQLSNPVSSLISVPFEGNWDTGAGADGKGDIYTLKIQPVIPFRLTPDLNLISRTIVPVITETDVARPHHSQTGLGDTTQSLFLSPEKPLFGWLIVGAGPVMLVPTGTDASLSSRKWAAGPTAVALTQMHGWIMGILVNQLWSFAGNPDRDSVNALYMQPFITFTTKKATTFGINTETLCNWRVATDRCSVPINLTVGQLVHVGKQPISFTVGGRYYAERSEDSPKWGLRFVTTFLFPARKH